MSDRSQEGLRRGQQLYAVIEFCSDPETLWSKIASGHWDWLGVRKDRTGTQRFVLGRPPISKGFQVHAAGRVGEEGVSQDHRTTIQTPDFPDESPPRWYRSAEDAAEGFDELVRSLEEPGGSGLFRVRLYEGDSLVKKELVVRARPNEL